jgi:branched-chain amino acid transport system ATP-binding protein
VIENLRVGAYARTAVQAQAGMERVFETFPRLRERRTQLAGTMSGGEQAMLSIGRGLMAAPRLLIIDEPSLGLSPLYVKENFSVIRRINESGVTVLLVEQNVRQTLAIAHRGYVLAQGRVAAQGDAAALRDSAEVRAAYFGRQSGGDPA